MRIGGAGGGHDLVFGGVRTAIAQVVGHRAGKEIDVLLYQPDLPPQAGQA